MLFVNSFYRLAPRGKLGSSVFSSNQYGNYEKMWKAPRQPRTPAQLLIRSAFTVFAQMWRILGAAANTAWNGIAAQYIFTKNAKTYKLSGFSFFIKLNQNLALIGQPAITVAPASILPPASIIPISVNITTTPGTEDIKLFIPAALPASSMAVVRATTVVKPGTQSKDGNLRNIGTIDSTFISGGSIKSMYLAKYGALPGTGDRVYFEVTPYDTASGWQGAKCTALATGTI